MIRPSPNDLRNASQISVVRGEVDGYLANMISEGRPLSATAEARFFYLGLTGTEAQERITEDCFYGRDDENPRQPGYYAIEVCTLHDGKSCTGKPWFAVFRDQSSQQVGQQRDRSVEGGYGDLMEEYRLLNAQSKRELQEQIRKNHQLQTELDTFTVAYNTMRKQALGFEIERDKAIHDAEHMEHERNLAIHRCNELEVEAQSFKPQIEQMVDGFVKKVGPQAQQMFMAMGGSAFGLDDDDEEDGESGGDKKKPTPPWSGGGGPGGANGAPNGVSGSNGKGKPTPMSDDPEMPTPEVLARALCYLFWEFEPFGRFVHFVQKGDDGNALVPWWVIRGVVFYDSGTDIGPSPIWPSDVKKADAEAKKAAEEASEETSSNPRPSRDRAQRPAARQGSTDRSDQSVVDMSDRPDRSVVDMSPADRDSDNAEDQAPPDASDRGYDSDTDQNQDQPGGA